MINEWSNIPGFWRIVTDKWHMRYDDQANNQILFKETTGRVIQTINFIHRYSRVFKRSLLINLSNSINAYKRKFHGLMLRGFRIYSILSL